VWKFDEEISFLLEKENNIRMCVTSELVTAGSSRLLHSIILYMDTNVSEEHTAPIFRVKVSGCDYVI
jgi:hypothetical protein